MSEKQDRQGARTIPDLERKLNLGQRFSEVMGVANDARTSADTAKDAAKRAEDAVSKLDTNLSSEELFNRLTDNGKEQGIYREDGLIYINASYLKAGIIKGIEIIGEEGSIGGFNMTDKTLSVDWRTNYGPYTPNDLATVEAIYRSGSATTEQIYKYDVNMNGRIDSGDAVAISGMIYGTIPAYSVGRITIDSSSLVHAISIEILEGYRAGEKTTIGLGGIQTNFVSADSYYCGNSRGTSGTFTIGDKTVTIAGGLITSVG